MAEAHYWEEPHLPLRTLHLDGYRWATAAELRAERDRRTHPANVIRNGDQPFLVADLYGPTHHGDDARDGDMWRAFLQAEGQDGVSRFAETWGMPAGFGLVRTSRSIGVPWPTIKRAQEALRTATRLLMAHDDDALADVVRFDPSRGSWEALVWIEGWGFEWSRVPPEVVEGARSVAGTTAEVSRRIAAAIATSELSDLVYRHTRNVLVTRPGLPRPDVHRLSDPIGGMALYLAKQVEVGEPLA